MSNAEVLGRFVWHELLTTDTAAAAAFYPKVVPWRTQPSNMPGYTIWMAGGTQVGGLMALPAMPAGRRRIGWCMSARPTSMPPARRPRAWARVCARRRPTSRTSDASRCSPIRRARRSRCSPPEQDRRRRRPRERADFSWHELSTTDVAAALRFYGELFGWRKGPGHDMGTGMGVYQLFEHGGAGVGGMHTDKDPRRRPSWLSYVQVADADRTVAAAKAAGGRLLHGPMEVPGGSWIALFLDPQGGAFAVQQMARVAAQPKAAARRSRPPHRSRPRRRAGDRRQTGPPRRQLTKAAKRATKVRTKKPAKSAKKKAAKKSSQAGQAQERAQGQPQGRASLAARVVGARPRARPQTLTAHSGGAARMTAPKAYLAAASSAVRR